jgi:hypothetical protein
MADEIEERCGRCIHWRHIQDVQIVGGGAFRQGNCNAPLPLWAGAIGYRPLGEHEGSTCRAFLRADAADTTAGEG